jgi:protein SCO1
MCARIRIAAAVLLCSVAPLRATEHPVRSIPDVPVVDQDGRTLHFYSDLIKGKPLVVVTFIFTTCVGICPMQGQSLDRLQAALGDRLGRDVHIVAISVDPETDTPARLKAWGAQFHARRGWTLVTGERQLIDQISTAFVGGRAAKGEHSPVTFVGSDVKSRWLRVYGLSPPHEFQMYFDDIGR